MKKLLLVPLCIASITACTTPTKPEIKTDTVELAVHSEAARQLQAAETKWQSHKLAHYTYTLRRTCYCPKEYNEPIEIRVLNGVVQSAMLPFDHVPLPAVRMDEALTVNDLFAQVHKAITNKAAKIDIKYDWQYGYPTSIAIDWDKMMADEETYFTARGLYAR